MEISPHGGRLVDRVLRGDALQDARERAGSLKRIALNARTMSDLELLAVGAYSPLEGFMGEADYRTVLNEMRLLSGLPWTLPITLAVRQTAARTIRVGEDIALVTPWEAPLGILHVEEHFAYNGREESRLAHGADDPRHTGAQYQLTRGDVLLPGPVALIARQPLKGFDAVRLDSAHSRARVRQLRWPHLPGLPRPQPEDR